MTSPTQALDVSLAQLIAPKFYHLHNLIKKKRYSSFNIAGGK